MPLALHTLTADYRRRSAPLPTMVAFQAPITVSLRAPRDHDAFAAPDALVRELADDMQSVRDQVDAYLTALQARARSANVDIGDEVGRVSDALADIMGRLQQAGER